MPGASTGTFSRAIFVKWALVFGGLGCIYPIAILIVMRTRAVRDYYNSARG